MKKEQTKSIVLKKNIVAKIDMDTMKKIKGGDCIPTLHVWSYFDCETSQIY